MTDKKHARAAIRVPLDVTPDASSTLRYLQIVSAAFPVPMHTLSCHQILFSYVPDADPRKVSWMPSSSIQLLNRVTIKSLCDEIAAARGESHTRALIGSYEETASGFSTEYTDAMRATGAGRDARILAVCRFAVRSVELQLRFVRGLLAECTVSGPHSLDLEHSLSADIDALAGYVPSIAAPRIADLTPRGRAVYTAELSSYITESRLLRVARDGTFATAGIRADAIPEDEPWSTLIEQELVDREVAWISESMEQAGNLAELIDESLTIGTGPIPPPPRLLVLPARAVKGELATMFPNLRTYC